jgi:hypothetical protein
MHMFVWRPVSDWADARGYKHAPRDMQVGDVFSKESGDLLFRCTRYLPVGAEMQSADWVRPGGSPFVSGEQLTPEIEAVILGYDCWEQRNAEV